MTRERRTTIAVCPRCNDQLDIDALVVGSVAADGTPALASDRALTNRRETGGHRHRDARTPLTCPACHVALDVIDLAL